MEGNDVVPLLEFPHAGVRHRKFQARFQAVFLDNVEERVSKESTNGMLEDQPVTLNLWKSSFPNAVLMHHS